MNKDSKIILALDFNTIDDAASMIGRTSNYIAVYKLGLEFYLANGATGVSQIRDRYPDAEIFLDLKLHDIPNTVAKAAEAVAHLGPRFLTVHASGGAEMVRAAALALPNTEITAVTVLTSLDSSQLKVMGISNDTLALAVDLAKNATAAGAKAVVCSPLEVSAIRAAVGPLVTLITPGVRAVDGKSADQKRTATAQQAIAAGANYVVIGRPITQAQDPTLAAAEIFSSLQ